MPPAAHQGLPPRPGEVPVMLTREENETLTRIGPGTAMGEVFRRYWLPAMLSEELPAVDGPPVRVRLLGEDLVAFRATDGRIGLLHESCPHRCASLALALNAESGLRCIYHGYKFDVDGRCTETPTEPPNSNFGAKIRARAYPTREAGGVIWAYLGPVDRQPPFPEFEWLGLPPGHAQAYKVYEECNYAQATEGAVDSAHAGVLHRRSPWGGEALPGLGEDLSPELEVEYTQYGLRYSALRKVNGGNDTLARITAVVLPSWAFIPPNGAPPRANRRLANAFIPRDDESTWHFQFFYDRSEPVDTAFRQIEGGIELDADYKKLSNRANWYRQDRERTPNFSGISGILVQDHAVGETQGRILDRSREHLGTSDVAIIAWRRLMLRTAKLLAETGEAPPGVHAAIPFGAVSSETLTFSTASSWRDLAPLVPELVK